MTIINNIRACLDTHLTNTVGIPLIARQNVPFKPVTGTPYLQGTLVPTSIRPAVRGLNPQKRYDGLYSILIATPEGLGSGAGYEYTDLLLDRFASTTDISYTNPTTSETIILSIDYSEVRTSFLDPPFYYTPVTVAWYIYH